MTQAIAVHEDDYLPAVESFGPEAMAAKLAEMRGTLSVVQAFFKDVMVQGQDYGVIPGTEKPSLWKPGAEKLCELYGFATKLAEVLEEERGDGFYNVRVTMALVSKRTGNLVGEGIGSANTFEDRYRWRWVYSNNLPEGFDSTGLVKQSGKNSRGSWTRYRVQNQDLYSLHNTVLKMAKKRALVDAALAATRTSGIFSQDTEDLEDWIKDENAARERMPGAIGEPELRGDPVTGEVIDEHPADPNETPWQTLTRLMKDADLTSSALKPFLSFSESGLSAWLDANPGKAVADLVAMAKGS